MTRLGVQDLSGINYIYNSIRTYYLMQTEPTHNSKEIKQEQAHTDHIPFDGFVNVNDIVQRRRMLRNAEFNVPDSGLDADFNPLPTENKDKKTGF